MLILKKVFLILSLVFDGHAFNISVRISCILCSSGYIPVTKGLKDILNGLEICGST